MGFLSLSIDGQQPRGDPCLPSIASPCTPRQTSTLPNAYPTLARLRRHTHQTYLIIKPIPWGKSDRARKDLKAAFPYEPRAIVGGFLGELALCSTDGNKIHFQLIEKSKEKWVPFHTIELDRAASSEGPTPRSKTYCLDELLSWPGRGDQDHEISYSENDGRRYHVSFMGMEAYKIRGVTHFHLCDDLPFLRINEENSTHPYGHRAKEILRNTDGVILDIGSGIQNVDDLLPNVVYLDAVHFENIDVVGRSRYAEENQVIRAAGRKM